MRLLSFISLFIFCAAALYSCNNTSSPIVIENAWIREAPPNATAMAGYMRIKNISDKHIILHSAASPAFKAIEFHRSVEKDGVYRMIPHLHLHIAANSTFELKPGDYHLMLFNPVERLQEGDSVTLALKFSGDQIVEATMPVKKAQY